MIINPYEVLGIREGAGMDEIKRAYRLKARECHPDLHPDDPTANERMQRVNEAYDMLCNPDKYTSRRQAEPEPHVYDDYARRGEQYRQRNWQYTYYTAYGNPYAWRDWQEEGETDADARRARQQSAPLINPLRGVARFIGGIMLFRFLMGLLRIMLFGFLG